MKNKLIHSKSKIQSDLKYGREVIRQIEQAMKSGDWSDIAEAAQDLAGTFATISAYAEDNHQGIEDFGCKWSGEIAEIRAARSAS